MVDLAGLPSPATPFLAHSDQVSSFTRVSGSDLGKTVSPPFPTWLRYISTVAMRWPPSWMLYLSWKKSKWGSAKVRIRVRY